MTKCIACGKFLGAKEGIGCPKCKSRSHNECARVPVGSVVDDSWRCGICQSKVPKGRDPSTPILSKPYVEPAPSITHVIEPTPGPAPGQIESDDHVNIDVVRTLRKEMRQEFAKMQNFMTSEFKSSKENVISFLEELRELRSELSSTRVSFNERLSSYEERLQALEKARDNPIRTDEVSTLERALTEVKLQFNEREQEYLLNEIVITGVPEHKGENSAHLVSLVAVKMGMTLDDRDIVVAEREGAPRRAQEGSQAAVRTRRITVRFARRATRDDYLKSARVRRGITSTDLGIDGAPSRIYVNERLTRQNAQTFAKAREECRARAWKYCWSREGKIYVRKEQGAPYFRVRTETDLERIFHKPSV